MNRRRSKRSLLGEILVWVMVVSPIVLTLACIGLKVQVNRLSLRMDNLTVKVETMEKQQDNLTVKVNTLERQQDELKTSVANLEKQQDELQISFSHKVAEMTEAQAGAVQQPTGQAYTVTVAELQTLAKIVYREARGIPQKSHQAAVIWCILNRVDDGYWGEDIITVATYPNAFAWVPDTPVEEELMDLAIDVVTRWNWEKQGLQDVGRTLPNTYLYFTGNGSFNYFTEGWKGTEYWDWSLPDPYLS